MKHIPLLFLLVFSAMLVAAQMDVPASGNNPRALVSEEVGITSITIKYSRPDVNKREGKVWGELIPWGFSSLNLNTNKNNMPWRAGANENTTITFEHDVKVEGKNIKAGTYGLHLAMWPDSAVLIFSTQAEAWGSFYYDEKYDALRTTIKPVVLDKSVEWLKFEFIEHKEKYCVVAMQWEKVSVPFKIEVDVDNIVLSRLREQVASQKGFNSTNMIQASSFCFNRNVNLEEALGWAQRAITGFQGQKSYPSLRNLATGYEKLNRLPQADSIMTEAMTLSTVNQHIAYGRALIAQKRADKALEIMQGARSKYGDVFAVNNGLSFAYAAKGDFKNAEGHAEKAKAQAPNEAARKTIEANIAKLKEGKDIN